jgi:hypothetical protein
MDDTGLGFPQDLPAPTGGPETEVGFLPVKRESLIKAADLFKTGAPHSHEGTVDVIYDTGSWPEAPAEEEGCDDVPHRIQEKTGRQRRQGRREGAITPLPRAVRVHQLRSDDAYGGAPEVRE